MRALNHNIRNACVNLKYFAKKIDNAGDRLNCLQQIKRIETALLLINGMWFIKNLDVINLHSMLQEIAGEVKQRWGLDVITSGFRPGDPKCHGTDELRAIDLRIKDDKLGAEIEAWVNAWYQYDPKRPTMKVAWYHGKAKHLHLQVHPRTRKKSLNTNRRFPV